MIDIKNKIYFSIIAVVLTLAVAFFVVPENKLYETTYYEAFDTVSTIKEYSMFDNTDEYTEILKELENSLSVYHPSSITYRINNGETVTVSKELCSFISRAKEYSLKHGEYFDITVNPAIDLWSIAEIDQSVPMIPSSILDDIGAEHISIDEKNNTVSLTNSGSSLNFGAIAKGYATNRVKDEMIKNGVRSGIINLGGNIYVLGMKPDNTPWKVGISDPNSENGILLSVTCTDKAVVTSSNANRSYEINGEFFSHIIDPKNATPVSLELKQVTIISEDAELADMLSTAVFVAGAKDGLELIKEYSAEAVLVTDTAIFYTSGLEEIISDKNSDLPYIPLEEMIW